MKGESAPQQDIAFQKQVYQKFIENNKHVNLEITELRRMVENYHSALKQVKEQLSTRNQIPDSTFQMETKLNSEIQEKKLFLNDRFRDVFDLHKQGLSVEQIARELEKEYDEVSFILQLANRTNS